MTTRIISEDESYSDLLYAAAFIAERVESVDGMSEAMAEVVPRFLERGEVDLAAALADVTVDPLTRDRLLVAVAEKCIEKRDDEYGLQLVEAVEDVSLGAGALERVALKMIERGDIASALEIAETLGHPDEVFKMAAIHMYTAGEFEKALATGARITVLSSKASLALSLAKVAHENQSSVEFENQIRNTERYATEIDLGEEAATLLIEAANLCAESGRADLAIVIFEKAREAAEKLSWPHRDNLLGAVAAGLFVSGSVTLADMALDLVTDKAVIARTLVLFAHHMRKSDNLSGATQALDEAFEILRTQKDKEIRDYRANNGAWRALALQYVMADDCAKALAVIEAMPDDETQASAATQCAVVSASRNDIEKSRTFLGRIGDPLSKVLTLVAMTGSLEGEGSGEKVRVLLEECLGLLVEIEQPVALCAVLTDLFHAFAEIGDEVRANQCVDRALRECSSIINLSNRSVVLARLSSKLETKRRSLSPSDIAVLEMSLR